MRPRFLAPAVILIAAFLVPLIMTFSGASASPSAHLRPSRPCPSPQHHGCRTPTPTPTVTTPPPTTPPPTTPPPTTPPPTTSLCKEPLGANCGPYSYPGIPMSNGFDTYVGAQNVGSLAGTTALTTATDPGNWSVLANAVPAGYEGVQIYANVQQLTNDWNGSGWQNCDPNCKNTPLASLSHFTINYSETDPATGVYQWSPDIWQEGYPSDVMFWADVMNRCNEGAFGGTVLGHTTLGGQNWTVHRYGGAGAEIIFVLDGAGGPGTCAQQKSGSIDIKAGLEWLAAGGYIPSPVILTQVNSGWEICSSAGGTFTMKAYSMSAGV